MNTLIVALLCSLVPMTIIGANPKQEGKQSEENGGRFAESKKYEAIFAKASKRKQGFLAQARQARKASRYAEADALYRKALLDPSDASVWIELGEMWEELGKPLKAIPPYHEVMYPQNGGGSLTSDPIVRLHYALLLAQVGRREEAVEAYGRAYQKLDRDEKELLKQNRLTPDGVDLTRIRGVAHALLSTLSPLHREITEAQREKHLASALSVLPDSALVQYEAGLFYETHRDRTRALGHYRKALAHSRSEFKKTVMIKVNWLTRQAQGK